MTLIPFAGTIPSPPEFIHDLWDGDYVNDLPGCWSRAILPIIGGEG
jgi:hypothetical protein